MVRASLWHGGWVHNGHCPAHQTHCFIAAATSFVVPELKSMLLFCTAVANSDWSSRAGR